MRRLLYALAFSFSSLLNAQTTLPTSWNFSNPGITTPPVGWTLTNMLAGGTGGQTYAFGMGDNLSCRFDAAGENLIIQFVDKPGALSYYVSPQNAGNPWSGLFEVQQSIDGSSWSTVHSFTSTSTTVTNFTNGKNTDNLNSTTRFVRFMFTTKTSGNFALDSVLILPAPPPSTPTINIRQAGNVVVPGSTFVVGKTAATTFTIENKGTAQTLYITGASFKGKDSADYSVSNLPDSVTALSSKTFTLNFTASQNGSRLANITVLSNDADKSAYSFNLYGIGGSFATEPLNPPGLLQVSNVKAYGFDVKITAPASSAPEHYIILRSESPGITDAPIDGITYKKGDYIGKAQVLYIGDSPATVRPTHILANTNYALKALSFNGPPGFENYLVTNPSLTLTTPSKEMGSYYNGINSAASNFVTTLSAKINPHDTIFYSQYISRFVDPFLTRDTAGGKKVMNCVYTGMMNVYTDPFVWWNGTNSGTLTREHTYPQSWMPTRSTPTWPNAANGKEFPEYNDMHHLFPADQTNGNGVRSNYPLGKVVSNAQPSPTGRGILGKDANGATVYEPADEHKGDAARALFYMCVAYNGISGNNWALPASQDIDILKQWHFQDLPDNWEIARHEFIASVQHNRNPFIDSVNFVCRIDFRNMTWIANPGTCGIIDKQLALIAPTAGDLVYWDATPPNVDIEWTQTGIDSLKIELMIEDTVNAILIASTPAGVGKYSWIPPHISTQTAQIRISDLHSPKSSVGTYFTIRSLVGFDEVLKAEEVFIYPNPSRGHLQVSLSSGIQFEQVVVRDFTGRIVQTSSSKEVELNNSGVYFMEVKTNIGTVVKRVIVW